MNLDNQVQHSRMSTRQITETASPAVQASARHTRQTSLVAFPHKKNADLTITRNVQHWETSQNKLQIQLHQEQPFRKYKAFDPLSMHICMYACLYTSMLVTEYISQKILQDKSCFMRMCVLLDSRQRLTARSEMPVCPPC